MEISLRGVRFYAHHGVFDQERKVGNEFTVDISVRVPVSYGMRADSLEGTLSYADIYEVASHEMSIPSLTLEHVAIRIATSLRNRWPELLSGSVAVCKVTPPIAGYEGSASVTYTF